MIARLITVFATALGVSAIVASAIFKPLPRLLWNASASAPIGFYAVQPITTLAVGDLVVVQPPRPLEAYLVGLHYIGAGVPLIKRVAALTGQTVCRDGLLISVDGTALGSAQVSDHLRRSLPVWHGCTTLMATQVFLMTWSEPASLDGRYFGPLLRSSVIGRAVPIWTRETQ